MRCSGGDVTQDSKPVYEGLGGWLLFLCVSLTLVGPLLTLGYLVWLIYLNTYYVVPEWVPIEILLLPLLAVFSVYAGVALWTLRPRGVRIVKIYLVVAFSISVLLKAVA